MIYTATLTSGNGQHIKIQIPTAWDDVPFNRYHDLLKMKLSDEFGIYAHILNVQPDVVKNISLASFEIIMEKLAFLNDVESFNVASPDHDIVFKNVRYIFKKNIAEAEVCRYKDWQSELTNMDDDPMAFVPRTLAYFLHESGEVYDYSRIDQREKLFGELPALTAVQLFNFFLRQCENLNPDLKCQKLNRTLTYYLRELMNSTSSVFTILWWNLPGVIFSILTTYAKRAFRRCTTFCSDRLLKRILSKGLSRTKRIKGK